MDETGSDLGERVQRLAGSWRSAVSRPPHPAGCTCMGHMLIPAMGAREMEADILDYMRSRYAAEGLDGLVRLLDAREVEREADIPAPFRAWLLRLPHSGVAGDAIERFVADLSATLDSLNANSGGGGSQLFCT